MTFDELANKITQKQQDILTWIWKSFCEKKQWPLTRVVHHQFGKDLVVKELRPLGGTIIHDFRDVGKQRYQLTLLGVLLTGQGADVLESLAGYLAYIKKRFMNDPENDAVTSKEILSDGDLTNEQVILIGKLLPMSPILGR